MSSNCKVVVRGVNALASSDDDIRLNEDIYFTKCFCLSRSD